MAVKKSETAPENTEIETGTGEIAAQPADPVTRERPSLAVAVGEEEQRSERAVLPRERAARLSGVCDDEDAFCVYLGPSIQGVILNGTVFSTGKAATLAEIKSVLEKYPLVADLIVPGDVLPESRIKVKTPGNLLYVNYGKLAGRRKIK